MSTHKQATPGEMRVIGTLAAAAGLYFMLVGFAVLPVPGGPRNLHAPLWVVWLAGLVFLLAGGAVLLQALGRANEQGELSPEAPQWMRVAQYLIGVAIFASFALIGSFVAIGGDPRQFSGNFMLFGESINVLMARSMFGLGALICWLCTIAFAVSGARKLRGRGKH